MCLPLKINGWGTYGRGERREKRFSEWLDGMATFFIDLAWPQWNAWCMDQEREMEEELRVSFAAYMKLASRGQDGSVAV